MQTMNVDPVAVARRLHSMHRLGACREPRTNRSRWLRLPLLVGWVFLGLVAPVCSDERVEQVLPSAEDFAPASPRVEAPSPADAIGAPVSPGDAFDTTQAAQPDPAPSEAVEGSGAPRDLSLSEDATDSQPTSEDGFAPREVHAEVASSEPAEQNPDGVAIVAPPMEASQTSAEAVKEIESLDMIIVGDSLANGYWQGFYRLKQTYPFLETTKQTVRGSGLTAFEWQERLMPLLSRQSCDLVLVALGINDMQVLLRKESPRRVRYNSDLWIKEYETRVRQLMGFFAEHDVRVLWLGLPVMRKDALNEHALLVNEIYGSAAREFDYVWFVSLAHLTAGTDGSFITHGENLAGKTVRLRLNDGIHFTADGYELIAEHIVRHIRRGDIPTVADAQRAEQGH